MSTNNTITVAYYGIHWDSDNVAYLMQGRSGTNAIGSATRAPFLVKPPGRARHCNHQIPLASPIPNDTHWNFFLDIYNDPLVQAMLPVPKSDGGVYFAEQSKLVVEYLVLLSKMSSPIYSVVQPMWNMTPQKILDQLDLTNVQPVVITDCKAKDSGTISQIAKMAVHKPRTIIFVGDSDVVVPSNAKKITWSPKLMQLLSNDETRHTLIITPWEIVGAIAVRKYMRGQWPLEPNPVEGSDDKSRTVASSSTRRFVEG